MLQAIGTGCGCPDDRFRKTSLCSALKYRSRVTMLDDLYWYMRGMNTEIMGIK